MEKKINFLYGRRSIEEFIQKKIAEGSDDFGIREVYTKRNPSLDIKEILSQIPKKIKVHELPPKELDQRFPTINHQGLIFNLHETKKKDYKKDFHGLKIYLETNKTPVLILDRIQDAGNLGNIIRTAECFGFKTILISEKDSVGITEAVARVSSGAIHHTEIFTITNLFQAIELLKEKGYWIVATSDRGLDTWDKVPDASECAVIMGNEKEGVKRILLENADFVCNIPMHGSVSSLNVVVATGIVLDRIQNRN